MVWKNCEGHQISDLSIFGWGAPTTAKQTAFFYTPDFTLNCIYFEGNTITSYKLFHTFTKIYLCLKHWFIHTDHNRHNSIQKSGSCYDFVAPVVL